MAGPGYTAHADFVAPAQARSEFGRLVLGVMAIELLYYVSRDLLTSLLEVTVGPGTEHFLSGDTPAGLLLDLSAFGFLIAWVALIVARQHQRGFLSLIGPPGIALRQFRLAFFACASVFLAIELLPPYWGFAGLAETRGMFTWLALLPLALVALLIQTGAEELMYRGYIQQQIAARFATPWIWLTLPNILFAAAHWNVLAPLADNAQYVIWAFFFGLAASDLTARAGTLGPAVAFHLVNNAYAYLFFAEQGRPDSGLALWLFNPHPDPLPGAGAWITLPLLIELSLVGLMWLAARLALRR